MDSQTSIPTHVSWREHWLFKADILRLLLVSQSILTGIKTLRSPFLLVSHWRSLSNKPNFLKQFFLCDYFAHTYREQLENIFHEIHWPGNRTKRFKDTLDCAVLLKPAPSHLQKNSLFISFLKTLLGIHQERQSRMCIGSRLLRVLKVKTNILNLI